MRKEHGRTLHALWKEKGAIEGDELIYMQDIADTSPEMTLWNTQLTRAFHHFRGLQMKHQNENSSNSSCISLAKIGLRLTKVSFKIHENGPTNWPKFRAENVP